MHLWEKGANRKVCAFFCVLRGRKTPAERRSGGQNPVRVRKRATDVFTS